MSRLSLLSSALAGLTLAAGAMGFAATGGAAEKMRQDAPRAPTQPIADAGQGPGPSDLMVRVRPGEELVSALLRARVAGLDAALAARQAEHSPSGPVEIWVGETVGAEARALERLQWREGAARLVVIERSGDDFVRRDQVAAVDQTPVRLRLAGGAGLAADLVEAGLPRDTRHLLLDEVAGEPLAAVDIIVAHQASELGSAYGKPLYLAAYLGDGSVKRWLGEGGRLRPVGSDEPVATGLLRPLPGPVTSSPGLRFHPILRFLRWHRGTDFAAPGGTPVQAALGGRVVAAGWQGGYGRTVRIAHPDGSTTLYAHLSAIEVEAGEQVTRGAVVGRVGASGLATGPHLHFEWQRGGATLTPSFASAADAVAAPTERRALQALLSAPYRLPPRRS